MSDHTSKTGSLDLERIKLAESYEVRDWAAGYGVMGSGQWAVVSVLHRQAESASLTCLAFSATEVN